MPEAGHAARWSEATDTELGQALLRRDAAASHEAFVRFSPLVNSVARRVVGPFGDVEDAVQEVFLRILASVRGLREPGALRAFVITVTSRTLSHERRRRRKNLRETADEDGMDTHPGKTEANAAARNAWIGMRRLLERLRPRDRRTFVLHYVEGMNAVEIAQTLGVSIPTVRRSLMRARERIDVWARRDAFLADYLSAHPAHDLSVHDDAA